MNAAERDAEVEAEAEAEAEAEDQPAQLVEKLEDNDAVAVNGNGDMKVVPVVVPALAPLAVKPAAAAAEQQLFDKDASEWFCCCGNFHVERGARIIAVIAIVVKLLALISNAISQQWFPVGLEIIGCFMYSLILLAQWKRNHKFYLPFLIVNGIYITAVAVAIALLVIAVIAVYKASNNLQYAQQMTPYGSMPVAPQQPVMQPYGLQGLQPYGQQGIQPGMTPYGFQGLQPGMTPYGFQGFQSGLNVSPIMLCLDAILLLADLLISAKHESVVYKAYKYMMGSHTVANGQVQPDTAWVDKP